jgi:hypothetical protein
VPRAQERRADDRAAVAASTSDGWSYRCGALPVVGPTSMNNDVRTVKVA